MGWNISCGLSTVTNCNYELIRSSGMSVSSLMIPHQMNEYFKVIRLFDGGGFI